MQIEKLTFKKGACYEENPGRWTAVVDYSSTDGKCTIPLAPEVAEKLLALCLPVIVEFSTRATQAIAQNCQLALDEANHPAIPANVTTSEDPAL